MRRGVISLIVAAPIAIGAWVGAPSVVLAAPPPTTAPPVDEGGGEVVEPDPQPDVSGADEATPVTLPLVPVPVGCTAPPMPHVVFIGTVRERDYRTVQYRIETIRDGSPVPFALDDRINIRYGLDAQYLRDGDRYLVSAVVDPVLGILVSRVTAPIEDFGGDEVIGVSESDVNCPAFEDPVRTLHVDGTPIEASLLAPLGGAKLQLLGALLVPLGVALGAIFLLATFRLSLTGLFHAATGVRRRKL